MTKSFHSL